MAQIAALAGLIGCGLMLAGCGTLGASPGMLALAPTSAGGLAGSALGATLDGSAQKAARNAEYQALEFGRTGMPVPWASGNTKGEVVPGARYQINASNCRDFTHVLFVGTERQSARGTACRLPNGTWQPVT